MTTDDSSPPATVDAATVMSAAFKLLGIYMIFSAVLQSGSVMSAMFSVASAFANSSQVPLQQWGMVATNMLSVILAVGVAILLIRHADRAAHWFSMRADLQVPVMTPSRAWYRGTLIFIGVWVLSTKLITVVITVVWVIISLLDDSQQFVFPSPFAYGAISAFHAVTLIAIGLFLIVGAAKFGDWLYRISGAAKAEAATSEIQ